MLCICWFCFVQQCVIFGIVARDTSYQCGDNSCLFSLITIFVFRYFQWHHFSLSSWCVACCKWYGATPVRTVYYRLVCKALVQNRCLLGWCVDRLHFAQNKQSAQDEQGWVFFCVVYVILPKALVSVWFCDHVTATHSRCDCNVETLRSASSIKRAVCHVCYDLKKKSVFKKPLTLKTCNSLIMSDNRSEISNENSSISFFPLYTFMLL